MPVGFVYDPVFLTHQSRIPHPECPERLTSILRHISASGSLRHLIQLSAREATEADILRCHARDMYQSILDTENFEHTTLDADTYTHRHSFRAAKMAAGAVLEAIDSVVSRRVRHAFCAVRPPGHHAESHRAMGFCLFNNIAIGARYAQHHHALKKICIVDWDVHHGNGSQEIFYDDPSVMYISLHQYPLYPGTGASDECGSGDGLGTTRNFPMSAGCDDTHYLQIWTEDVLPILDSFHPDLVLISAGFDAHARDPLAQMSVSTEGFAKLTQILLMRLSHHPSCGIVSVLEGGYDLSALGESVRAHIEVLVADAP